VRGLRYTGDHGIDQGRSCVPAPSVYRSTANTGNDNLVYLSLRLSRLGRNLNGRHCSLLWHGKGQMIQHYRRFLPSLCLSYTVFELYVKALSGDTQPPKPPDIYSALQYWWTKTFIHRIQCNKLSSLLSLSRVQIWKNYFRCNIIFMSSLCLSTLLLFIINVIIWIG